MHNEGVVMDIVNKNHVRMVNGAGTLLGEAKRSAPGTSWFISGAVDGLWQHVGRVSGKIPEVLQRKLIQAILNTI